MVDNNLPLLRNIIDKLGKFNWISVIDLADSYHQFLIDSKDQPKLTFTIDGKRSMFTVAPFGVKIMTGILQRVMESLLSDIGVPPFLDDTAMALITEENHIALVGEVLQKLTYEAGLHINLKKCKFFRTEAKILGMIVSRDGVAMDHPK